MKIAPAFLLGGILLSACEKQAPDASRPAASAVTPSPTASATPSPSASAPVSASPTATASASASAAAASSPCAEGARKSDDLRYCVTLPEKTFPISYTDARPQAGTEEVLQVGGDTLVLLTSPVPAGRTVASLKKETLESDAGIVDSGDLPKGFWWDRKEADGHRIEGVVVGRSVINCIYTVHDEKLVEAARAVCKSLRTF